MVLDNLSKLTPEDRSLRKVGPVLPLVLVVLLTLEATIAGLEGLLQDTPSDPGSTSKFEIENVRQRQRANVLSERRHGQVSTGNAA